MHVLSHASSLSSGASESTPQPEPEFQVAPRCIVPIRIGRKRPIEKNTPEINH